MQLFSPFLWKKQTISRWRMSKRGLLGLSVVSDSAAPQTVAHQSPLPMEFSSQEYWSGLLFPTPGIFHIKGLNQSLLHLLYWQVYFLSLAPLEKPLRFSSVQFSSVTQSCPTLCNWMDSSTPGLLVYHQLPELTQTHVHWVSDAIQPSHPLSSPSPPAPNPSQHQSGLVVY